MSCCTTTESYCTTEVCDSVSTSSPEYDVQFATKYGNVDGLSDILKIMMVSNHYGNYTIKQVFTGLSIEYQKQQLVLLVNSHIISLSNTVHEMISQHLTDKSFVDQLGNYNWAPQYLFNPDIELDVEVTIDIADCAIHIPSDIQKLVNNPKVRFTDDAITFLKMHAYIMKTGLPTELGLPIQSSKQMITESYQLMLKHADSDWYDNYISNITGMLGMPF